MAERAQITTAARRAQALVAAVALAALLLRLGLTVFDPAAGEPGLGTRLLRYFSYFTIESNIAVLLAAVAVLRGWVVDAPWVCAVRLASMVGITITALVYVIILADDFHNSGLSQVANVLLHYVVPPLAVLTWVALGPWPALGLGDIWRALAWPAVWVAYTLVHGAISGWYPYDFIDVAANGYVKVLANLATYTVFAVLLTLLYIGVARWRLRAPR